MIHLFVAWCTQFVYKKFAICKQDAPATYQQLQSLGLHAPISSKAAPIDLLSDTEDENDRLPLAQLVPINAAPQRVQPADLPPAEVVSRNRTQHDRRAAGKRHT